MDWHLRSTWNVSDLGCVPVLPKIAPAGVNWPSDSRKKGIMDLPNAFVGKKSQPTSKEVAAALGPAAVAWNELTAWLTAQGIACKEWQSISPKYGWSLRPKLKARTILYLSPCERCLRVSFVLSDKAVAAARARALPKNLLAEIAQARRYAEGTGVRLIVKEPGDLASIRELVSIKLAS